MRAVTEFGPVVLGSAETKRLMAPVYTSGLLNWPLAERGDAKRQVLHFTIEVLAGAVGAVEWRLLLKLSRRQRGNSEILLRPTPPGGGGPAIGRAADLAGALEVPIIPGGGQVLTLTGAEPTGVTCVVWLGYEVLADATVGQGELEALAPELEEVVTLTEQELAELLGER